MPYTEQDVLDACLEAVLDIASEAKAGADGTLHDDDWAHIQSVLDLAEDPAALAHELAHDGDDE
jgi:hypothetical protein